MRFKNFAAKAKSRNHLKTGYSLAFHHLNPTPYPRKYIDLASALHNPKQEVNELGKCDYEAQALQQLLF